MILRNTDVYPDVIINRNKSVAIVSRNVIITSKPVNFNIQKYLLTQTCRE